MSDREFDRENFNPVEFYKLYALITTFFKGNALKANLWFQTRNPHLGNISPLEMIQMGRFRKLEKFILYSLEENEK
jgi:hypothetical protein